RPATRVVVIHRDWLDAGRLISRQRTDAVASPGRPLKIYDVPFCSQRYSQRRNADAIRAASPFFPPLFRSAMNRSDYRAADAPGSTSTSLLQRLRARDPVAWERLCQIYGPLVYRWARSSGLQDTDAADVVQEVFRSVAVSLDHFHHDAPTDSFRGWLWG